MYGNVRNYSQITDKSYIEVNLLRFVHLLRHSGLRISSAESVEALQALTAVDIKDRAEVKAALQGTLVKDREYISTFERLFDSFFVPETAKQDIMQKHRQRLDKRREQLEKAKEDLQFQEESLDLTEEEQLAYSEMSPEEQERLKNFLHETSQGKNVTGKFKPLVESLVKGHLQRWQQNRGFKAVQLESIGDEYLDALLAELNFNGPQEKNLLRQDMGSIEEKDIPHMNQVIRKLSRNLATRISRRYENSKKVKQIDIRRTIRSNLRYGGIPLDLRYREKRVRKPDLLLICDVSGSMARYSTFAMLFVAGLVSTVRKLQVFLFSEDLEQVQLSRHAAGKDMEKFARKVQTDSSVWGEGTNLNLSLHRLLTQYFSVLGSNTLVIIISDTKTLQPLKAAEKLRRVQNVVREVLWLNPMPAEQWEKHQTVAIFQRHCKMYLCNTLGQLERIIGKKLLK